METNRKIKLLRISTVPHSLHLLLRGQLKYMKSRGMEVYMASAYGPEIPALIQNESVAHFEVPLSRKLNPLHDLVALYKLILLLKKLKPDIVHTHSPKAGTVGMLAAYLCRIPVRIHTVAGLPLMETLGSKKKLLLAVEKFTYKFATWVLPNSVELKDYILREKIIDKREKLVVIGKGSSNGINLEYFIRSEEIKAQAKELRKENNINDNDVVLCFVGRLAFYKGINELVQAFIRLREKNPNVKLLLVGPYEDLNPLDSQTLEIINSIQEIITVGHQDDIRPFLAASDIFVFPSYREGFPQSLMQACAMELPCIATNINGCNEIVFNNVNGFLIAPKSIEDIVEKSEILIGDSVRRVELGKNGHEFIKEHFEQQVLWNKIFEFYQRQVK